MGRHPLGEKAMSSTERQRRFLARRERAAAAAALAAALPAPAPLPVAEGTTLGAELPAAKDRYTAFFERLAGLIPPPDNMRSLAQAYRDQARVHVDDLVDLVDVLRRLITRVQDERASSPERS